MSAPRRASDAAPGGAPVASRGREAAARTEPKASGIRSWTILDLLRWTTQHFAERGIDTARLDAELLLAHALGCDRLRLYVDHDKPIGEAERTRFRELVRARAGERVPVSILLGRREFWSLSLAVTREVLTPRPETETLVAAALDALPDREAEWAVLDVGTGSGAIALAIASERPLARVTASDVSPAALAVARGNARALGLAERVRFLEGPLFAPVAAELAAGARFDAVVSNPPYLARRDAAALPPELRHEPELALFAGEDGTDVLRALAAGVAGALAPGGFAAFELDPRQAGRVARWLAEAGLVDAAIHRDAAGRPRVVSARRPAA
jgi:release factor glutamine methyltransferase